MCPNTYLSSVGLASHLTSHAYQLVSQTNSLSDYNRRDELSQLI